jgi:hypothetical protein
MGDDRRNRNREPTPHSYFEPHYAYRFHQEQLTSRDHEHPAPAGHHLPPNNTLRHQARRCAPSCAPPVAEWGWPLPCCCSTASAASDASDGVSSGASIAGIRLVS